MSAGKIRVLIVDDSPTIRSALKIMIRREQDMEVVGSASNGLDSVRLVADLKPDIVLMDIEMPVMDGIEATEAIMDTNPVPVLIFSSVAAEAAPKTLEALARGAVDFVTKDGTTSAIDIGHLKDRLLAKIRQFGGRLNGQANPRNPGATLARNRDREREYEESKTGKIELRSANRQPAMALPRLRSGGVHTMRVRRAQGQRSVVRLAAIGASTGGPQALQTVISQLPRTLSVPVVVVQHMPGSFMPAFAKRLSESAKLPVSLAQDREVLHSGQVYIAPGGAHTRVELAGGLLRLRVEAADVAGVLHKPSVDILLQSISESLRGSCVVAILTGMGRDGAMGARELHSLGATVIAQDEASSVVWGMPRAVVEADCADMVLPVEEIGDALVEVVARCSTVGEL